MLAKEIKKIDVDTLCTEYCKDMNPFNLGSPSDPDGDDIRKPGGIIFSARATDIFDSLSEIKRYYERDVRELLKGLRLRADHEKDIADLMEGLDNTGEKEAVNIIMKYMDSLRESGKDEVLEEFREFLDKNLPELCFQMVKEGEEVIGECYLHDGTGNYIFNARRFLSENDKGAELKGAIDNISMQMNEFLGLYQNKYKEIFDIATKESKNLNPFGVHSALLPDGKDIFDQDGIIFHAPLEDVLDVLSDEAASRLLHDKYLGYCKTVLKQFGNEDHLEEWDTKSISYCVVSCFRDDESVYDAAKRQKIREVIEYAEPLYGKLCIKNSEDNTEECLCLEAGKEGQEPFYSDSLGLPSLMSARDLREGIRNMKERLQQHLERKDMSMEMRPRF